MNELATRPVWTPEINRNRRREVRFRREVAAYDLAALRFGEPTVGQVDYARSLLTSCTRWALADMRMLETETEHNVNSPYRKRKEEQLYSRMERLDERLADYGCRIVGHGVFEYDADTHCPLNDHSFLYFFD